MRRRLIGLLAVVAVAGCNGVKFISNEGAPMRLRYGPDNGQLLWKMVTDVREATGARSPVEVQFRVLPPVRVEGSELVLPGELENKGDEPAVVYLFGVDWQPLTLSVRYEGGLAWKQPCPDPWCAPQPPVPPPPFRITLPPHTVVEFKGRCDLRTIDYHGTPEATFNWRFGFTHTREAEAGALRLRLPER